MATFDSVVANSFAKRVDEIVATLADNMAAGSCMFEDPTKIAMKYNQEIGYVRGLRDALAFLRDIENELQGRTRIPGSQSDRE